MANKLATTFALDLPNKAALRRTDDGELLGLRSYELDEKGLAVEIIYMESARHSNTNLLHAEGGHKRYYGIVKELFAYAAQVSFFSAIVIIKETPICESLLIWCVVQSFGIMRAGSRIQNRITQILSSAGFDCVVFNDRRVFWRVKQKPELYSGFRASGVGTAKRETCDVPVQEASKCNLLFNGLNG